MVSSRPMVFVLMPFENEFEDVYEELIKDPLENIGYEVRRADSLFNQQQILKDVVKGIAEATIIIADVTGLNGNVLYELGLAHALGKRTVMITQQLDELPFDLRPYRANEYSTRFNRAQDLKQRLTEIGQAVSEGRADFSNPVQDFAPKALAGQAQILTPPQQSAAETPSDVRTPAELSDDEPGMLEYIVSIQEHSRDLVVAATQVGELTQEIGVKFKEHKTRLDRATTRLGEGAAPARLMIAREAGRDLDAYANALEPLILQMRESLAEVGAGMNSLARNARINDDDDLQVARSLLVTLQQAEASIAEGREGMVSLAETLLEIPHMERSLTAAGRKAARFINATAEIIETAESEFARARGVLQERANAYERGDS